MKITIATTGREPNRFVWMCEPYGSAAAAGTATTFKEAVQLAANFADNHPDEHTKEMMDGKEGEGFTVSPAR